MYHVSGTVLFLLGGLAGVGIGTFIGFIMAGNHFIVKEQNRIHEQIMECPYFMRELAAEVAGSPVLANGIADRLNALMDAAKRSDQEVTGFRRFKGWKDFLENSGMLRNGERFEIEGVDEEEFKAKILKSGM